MQKTITDYNDDVGFQKMAKKNKDIYKRDNKKKRKKYDRQRPTDKYGTSQDQ